MSGIISRRALFESGWRGRSDIIRPPWTPPEDEFADRCTACGECSAACPQNIIVKGRAGYPVVDFAHGACDFCGACADACPEKLFIGRDHAPWTVKARIGAECLSVQGVACRICAEWCDARAIRFRPEVGGRYRPEIGDADCTGCGECLPSCPAKAISMEESE